MMPKTAIAKGKTIKKKPKTRVFLTYPPHNSRLGFPYSAVLFPLTYKIAMPYTQTVNKQYLIKIKSNWTPAFAGVTPFIEFCNYLYCDAAV
jgi:hypothetical protein